MLHDPKAERTVHPLDPDLGITWPADTPLLSDRDVAAPSLKTALDAKLLPDYEVCREYTRSLRTD